MEKDGVLENEITEDETARACLSTKVLSARYIAVTTQVLLLQPLPAQLKQFPMLQAEL